MMTNVMAGSYPELFQAASVYSGVAFGCFAGASSWNTQCAEGELIQTPQQWVCSLLLYQSASAELIDADRDKKSPMLIQDTQVPALR